MVGERYRRFTPREVARIQSFPETFELVESESAQYKALGNAIPPVMFWYIMKSVKEHLDKATPKNWYAINKEKGGEKVILAALKNMLNDEEIQFPPLEVSKIKNRLILLQISRFLVRVGRFELPASWTQIKCPTNWATPGYLIVWNDPQKYFRSNCGQISGHRTTAGSEIDWGKQGFA